MQYFECLFREDFAKGGWNADTGVLDEKDYPNLLLSDIRPECGMEGTLLPFVDVLCQDLNKGSTAILVLDFSLAFSTINHSILLDQLQGLRLA